MNAKIEITVWRIVPARQQATAFSGEGSRVNGGRWNHIEYAAVYTSESLPLAKLEILVHVKNPDVLKRYVRIPAKILVALILEPLRKELPRGWQNRRESTAIRDYGTAWLKSMDSVVLKVPSVITPQAYNFILNPLHPDFAMIRVGKPVKMNFDPRLFPS